MHISVTSVVLGGTQHGVEEALEKFTIYSGLEQVPASLNLSSLSRNRNNFNNLQCY